MNRLPAFALAAMILFSATAAQARDASEAPHSKPIAVGGTFPDLKLKGTMTPEQTAYLGYANGNDSRRISGITAPLVLVEVFSMYCPHCQREAPSMIELYNLIKKRGLDGQFKIIGLGAGNSQAEVDIFRNKYALPFPLFVDPDFTNHAAVGGVGTPYFYLLAKDKTTGAYTVTFSRLGRMDSPESFLDELTAAAHLTKGVSP